VGGTDCSTEGWTTEGMTKGLGEKDWKTEGTTEGLGEKD